MFFRRRGPRPVEDPFSLPTMTVDPNAEFRASRYAGSDESRYQPLSEFYRSLEEPRSVEPTGPRLPFVRRAPSGDRREQQAADQRYENYLQHLRAEENAGRLLNPENVDLIKYYASRAAGRASDRRQQPSSPTPFLGRESSSPTFVGRLDSQQFSPRAGVSQFTGSSGPVFTGAESARDYRAFTDTPMFLGTNYGLGIGSVPSVADSVSGMMGGGLVGKRTPFRNGGVMDRMVSEMIRNSSK